MPGRGPRAAVVCRQAPLWERRRRRPPPDHLLIGAAAGSLLLSCSGGGGGVFPSRPRLSSPGTPSPAVVASGFLSPPGKLCHSGGVGALWRLHSPFYSLAVTPWVFLHSGGLVGHSGGLTPEDSWATPEASRPPSSPHTPEDLPDGFSCLPTNLPLCFGIAPWRPPSPTLSTSAEEVFLVSPPLAIASPKRPSAPLSSVPPAVAVYGLPSHPPSSSVIASSPVAKPSESSPLHPALSSALSLSPPPPALSTPPLLRRFLPGGPVPQLIPQET